MASKMRSLLDPDQVGWFVARQPAIVKLLESRLDRASDSFVVALDGVWRLASVFELRDDVAPQLLRDDDLAEAALTIAREAVSGQALADGAASRQTELCRWVAAYVADPPVPLTSEETAVCSEILITVLYAFDAATSGDTAMPASLS